MVLRDLLMFVDFCKVFLIIGEIFTFFGDFLYFWRLFIIFGDFSIFKKCVRFLETSI